MDSVENDVGGACAHGERRCARSVALAALVVALLASNAVALPGTSTALRIKLPFEKGTKRACLQGNHGSVSHSDGISNFAYDFDMPEGTPVLAVAAGRVVTVKQDSTSGGPTPDMLPYANKVWVDHGGGTYSIYLHLQANSAVVRPGELVDAGQRLASSGNTGFSRGPHLHFALTDSTQTSVPSRFVDVAGGLPGTGGSYVSGNDGSDTSRFQGDSLLAADTFAADGISLRTSMPATSLGWTDDYLLRGKTTRAAKNAVLYFCPSAEPKAVVWHPVPVDASGAFTLRFRPADFASALSSGGPFRVGMASEPGGPSKTSLDVCFQRPALDDAGNVIVCLHAPFPPDAIPPHERVSPGAYDELLDFTVPKDTTVLAAASGRVIAIGKVAELGAPNESRPRAGSFVRVDHGHGIVTDYLGLSADSIDLGEGEIVKGSRALGRTAKSPLEELARLGFGVRTHGTSHGAPKLVGFGDATVKADARDEHVFAMGSRVAADGFVANGIVTASAMPLSAYYAATTYVIEGRAADGVARVAFLVRRRMGRKVAATVATTVTDGAFRFELRLADVEKRLGVGPWDWALCGAQQDADFAVAQWLPFSLMR